MARCEELRGAPTTSAAVQITDTICPGPGAAGPPYVCNDGYRALIDE